MEGDRLDIIKGRPCGAFLSQSQAVDTSAAAHC
jgi:hypothetical protein